MTATVKTSNEEIYTLEEHEEVHEEDDIQIAPVNTTKLEPETTVDSNIMAKQEAITKKTIEEKEQTRGTQQSYRDYKTPVS